MKVEILRHPEEEDWKRCKMLALNTIGKQYAGADISDSWKQKILIAGHSPIRTLMFTIKLEIPYFVSVHFVRHKYGIEHYVQSQRNDRQSNYDREEASQSVVVSHIMDVNAQELIQIAQMRLCRQAYAPTRMVMKEIVDKVLALNPEFEPVLKPKCVVRGGCNEFVSCGLYEAIG